MGGTQRRPANSPVSVALADCRKAFWSVALFSGVVNLLMLAGPLYMLQVYDRVLPSGSMPTLVALSAFLVGCYAVQFVLDLIRSRVVVRSAALLDETLAGTVHDAVARLAVIAEHAGEAQQPLRDLDQIRAFLSSSGPMAIVDLPWMPIFLGICFLIHPWLGIVALLGGLVLFGVTLLTEFAGRGPVRALAREGAVRMAMVDGTRRNSETVTALGMTPALRARWLKANRAFLASSQKTADVVSSYGTLTRSLRLLLQSGLLGVGAYLVVHQELMGGAMIAASVMMGRALAPLETAIANWRGLIGARDSIHRLSETLSRLATLPVETALPAPERTLHVGHVSVLAPHGTKPVLADINFALSAGECLGVIGPSGAGKTCLARALTGIWPSATGQVRLDGASIGQWGSAELGRHIGYMAQSAELFDGTIAENIARMAATPDSKAVIDAARAAGAHEMILRLPRGYDTHIGETGGILSAGQRQRVALARALFANPFLIVLDEPNANLDGEGDVALDHALRSAKARGAIIVVVAHRPSALAICDKILLLAGGTQQGFGSREEVLRRVTHPSAPRVANLRVVDEAGAGGR